MTAPTGGPPPEVQWTDDFFDNVQIFKRVHNLGDDNSRATTLRGNNFDAAEPGGNAAYATAAVAAELARLAAAQEGARNDTLNRVAFTIFRLAKAGHVDADVARRDLERVAASIGLPDGEIRATLRSAWNAATARDIPPPDDASPPKPAPAQHISLAEAHTVFRRWLGEDYDTDALDAVLATAAVERFTDGSDPVWLLIVSGPGAAKTETVQALSGTPNTHIVSAITSDAALLSGTAARQKTKDATGGLLRRIGGHGILVIKDVTSILSMHRDQRAKVLAALRETYDGYWSREVGVDGGRVLTWSGRITVIGAVTTAWDTAHAVVSAMGDRFLLIRIDSTTSANRLAAGRRAVANTGDEPQMRAELAAAVAGVLAGSAAESTQVTDAEADAILAAADLVALGRTAVEHDYRGDVVDAHAPEMPTRVGKQLTQIVRGAVAVGMDRPAALRLAIRCARDSMPPLRRAIIDDLAAHPGATTQEVRRRLDRPRATVDRQLQALHMLGVVTVDEGVYASDGRARWHYRLADGIDPECLMTSCPEMSSHGVMGDSGGGHTGGDISGHPPPMASPPPRSPAGSAASRSRHISTRRAPAVPAPAASPTPANTQEASGELVPRRAARPRPRGQAGVGYAQRRRRNARRHPRRSRRRRNRLVARRPGPCVECCKHHGEPPRVRRRDLRGDEPHRLATRQGRRMNPHQTAEQRRAQRQRDLEAIRRAHAEVLMAPEIDDATSELALLSLRLDDEQRRLEELVHTDPVGLVWFGTLPDERDSKQ
ncbi:putative toxin [Mycobacterium canetti]|nr:putative toxin [Mycobacterium canetti]